MMVTGSDGMTRVELPIFGSFYPFMMLFAIVGIFRKLNLKFNKLDIYMSLLLLGSLPTYILILPNFVHFNVMFVSILYFEYIGVIGLLDTKFMKTSFLIIMVVLLALFAKSYLVTNSAELRDRGIEVSSDIKSALDATKRFGDRDLNIVTRYDKQYYPVVLFYEKIDPHVFYKTKEQLKPADHLSYSYFGKYHFYNNLSDIKISKKNIYIVQNNIGLDTTVLSKYKHKLYGTYTLYYK